MKPLKEFTEYKNIPQFMGEYVMNVSGVKNLEEIPIELVSDFLIEMERWYDETE